MMDSKRIAPHDDDGTGRGTSIIANKARTGVPEETAAAAAAEPFAIAVDPAFDDKSFAEAIGRMLMTTRRWGVLDPRMPTEVRVLTLWEWRMDGA